MPEITLTFSKDELDRLLLAMHLYYKECELSNKWPVEVEELHKDIAWKLYQKVKQAFEKAKEID